MTFPARLTQKKLQALQKALRLFERIRRLYESFRVVSALMGQGLGLASISEARASACVSIYSRISSLCHFER